VLLQQQHGQPGPTGAQQRQQQPCHTRQHPLSAAAPKQQGLQPRTGTGGPPSAAATLCSCLGVAADHKLTNEVHAVVLGTRLCHVSIGCLVDCMKPASAICCSCNGCQCVLWNACRVRGWWWAPQLTTRLCLAYLLLLQGSAGQVTQMSAEQGQHIQELRETNEVGGHLPASLSLSSSCGLLLCPMSRGAMCACCCLAAVWPPVRDLLPSGSDEIEQEYRYGQRGARHAITAATP
jgi:hypothetical protein